MKKEYKRHLKTSLKAIINCLRPCSAKEDLNFWEIRKHFVVSGLSIESAQQLVNELPTFKKAYEIDAYIDLHDGRVATSGWDMLGGPDPDTIVINGRDAHNHYNYENKIVVCETRSFEKYRHETDRRFPKTLPCVRHGNTSLVVHYR